MSASSGAMRDEAVFELRFEGKQFEEGVQSSLKSVENLKKGLEFKGAGSAVSQINADAAKVNLGPIASAVESINSKFSGMGVIAATALSDITHTALAKGKEIASAFTVDPIKQGFQEYQTQINAVQTIMANTSSKGTTLDQVNTALDTLNTYADKTIYNFTEMTRNIGTFTAAGVDLDTSVNAIQGIANLAAVSGSTSQQASTAMYQLSQALAAGTVRLQDWNSVVNAGMGGEVFQNALMHTAAALDGSAAKFEDWKKANIDSYGSFRESLTKGGWLTTEVLTATLGQMAGAYTEADLLSQGFTKDQAQNILQMAQTAEDAATKVKTFSQLIDTLKEAAQSGWTQTWEYIIGDFEEAKELWTNVSDVMGGIIAESADARNAALKEWKDLGGRTDLFNGLANAAKALGKILSAVKQGFEQVFPPVTGKKLADLTKKFSQFTEKLIISDETAKGITGTFAGIFTIVKVLAGGLLTVVSKIGSLVMMLSPLVGILFQVLGIVGSFVAGMYNAAEALGVFHRAGAVLSPIFTTIKSVLDAAFSGISGMLSKAQDAVTSFCANAATSAHKLSIPLSRLTGTLRTATAGFVGFGESINKAMDNAKAQVERFVHNVQQALAGSKLAFKSYGDGIGGSIAKGIGGAIVTIVNFAKTIKDAFDSILNGGAIGNFIGGMNSVAASINGVHAAAQVSFPSLGTVVRTVFGAIALAIGGLAKAIYDSISSIEIGGKKLGDIFADAKKAVQPFIDVLKRAADSLKDFAAKLDLGDVKDVAETGLFYGLARLVSTLNRFIRKDWPQILKGFSKSVDKVGDAIKGVTKVAEGITKSVTGVLDGTRKCLEAYQKNLAANRLLKIAVAIGILAAAILVLSKIPVDDLQAAAQALLVAAGILLVAVGVLGLVASKVDPDKMDSVSIGVAALAGSLLALSLAVKIISDLNIKQIGLGLGTITVLGVLLWQFAKQLGKQEASFTKGTVALLAFSLAIRSMAKTLTALGALPWTQVLLGLTAVGLMMTAVNEFVGRTKFSNMGPGTAVTLIALSTSIAMMVPPLLLLGAIPFDIVGQGLAAIAGILAEISVFANSLGDVSGGTFAAVSASMILISAAILVLVPSLVILGAIPFSMLAQGLVGVGVALELFAHAANEMTGTIDAAAAILLMSVAILALTPALIALSLVPFPGLIAGLAAIAGAFLIMWAAGQFLGPMAAQIVLLSASLLMIGGAVALTGAGLVAIGLGLTAIAAGITALLLAVRAGIPLILGSFESLLTGLILLAPAMANAAAIAFTEFVHAGLYVLQNCIPDVINAVVIIITAVLTILGEFSYDIADAVLNILEGIIRAIDEHSDGAITAFVNMLLNILTEIGNHINEFIQTGITLMVNFINGMAQGIRDNARVILEAVGNLVGQLINLVLTGVQMIAEDIPGIGATISSHLEEAKAHVSEIFSPESMGEIGQTGMEGMAQGVQNGAGALEEATTGAINQAKDSGLQLVADYSDTGKQLVESVGEGAEGATPTLNGMFEGVASEGAEALKMPDLFSESGEVNLKAFGDSVSNFDIGSAGDAIHTNLLNSVQKPDEYSEAGTTDATAFSGAFDSATNLMSGSATNFGNSGLDVLKNLVPQYGTAGTDSGTEYANKLNDTAPQAVTSADTVSKDALDKLQSKLPDFNTQGKDSGTKYADGITEQDNYIVEAANTVSTHATDALEEAAPRFGELGTTSAQNYGTGIDSEKDNIKAAGETIANNAYDGADSRKDDFYDAGANVGKGFLKGIEDYIDDCARAAARMASEALDAAMDELEEESPSKAMFRAGKFFDLGFVNGVNEYADAAADASADMASGSLDVMRDAMDGISKIVSDDVDVDPTIRPVLDLTDIQNGADEIGRLLGDGSYKIAAQANTQAVNATPGLLGKLMGMIGRMQEEKQQPIYVNNTNRLILDGKVLAESVNTSLGGML